MPDNIFEKPIGNSQWHLKSAFQGNTRQFLQVSKTDTPLITNRIFPPLSVLISTNWELNFNGSL